MREKELLDQIRMDHQDGGRLPDGRPGNRLFRNNVGTGYTGKIVRVPDGVLIRDARPLRAGLVRGSSDLIGWSCVTITPDMVGRTVAVFTAVEAKTGRVRVTDEQAQFLQAVADAGGIARVVRSDGETVEVIEWEAAT